MFQQSVLHPAGALARAIGGLWWSMFWVSAAVWLLVVSALAFAALRPNRRGHARDAMALVETPPGDHATMTRGVGLALAATVVVLLVFLFYDFAADRALAQHPARALTVQVVGHQWWWEVRYEDPDPSRSVTTANEMHIPVGVPVRVQLSSVDVIHSFWAPNLNGKRDLVPGYVTSTWIESDTAGVFRAQCAEFCGYQHAKMALFVVAEPRPRFEAWLAAQRAAPPPPSDAQARKGQRVFLAGPCANCHTIAGTDAYGTVGPDLSHVGSRLSLAAGTLPNTRGNLAGWIVDPQSIKPGADMPANQLSGRDLQALVAYLETLK